MWLKNPLDNYSCNHSSHHSLSNLLSWSLRHSEAEKEIILLWLFELMIYRINDNNKPVALCHWVEVPFYKVLHKENIINFSWSFYKQHDLCFLPSFLCRTNDKFENIHQNNRKLKQIYSKNHWNCNRKKKINN